MPRAPLLLALLLACRSSQDPPRLSGDPPPAAAPSACPATTLRIYKVPPGNDKLVERLLRSTLSGASASCDQAQPVHPEIEFTGTGYFVLTAPPSIHDGVRQLLDELARQPAPPAPASIDATYWLVLGWPPANTVTSWTRRSRSRSAIELWPRGTAAHRCALSGRRRAPGAPKHYRREAALPASADRDGGQSRRRPSRRGTGRPRRDHG